MSDTVVTLVCNPAAPMLDEAHAGALMLWLAHEDWAGPVARRILSPGVAEEYAFACAPSVRKELAAALRARFEGSPLDIVVQPVDGRRKRLLIADMDSTIIEQECLDELADFAGLKHEIAAITERAMQGALDFEAALKARVRLLEGLAASAIDETIRTRLSLTPGAAVLVATMRKHGARAVLVSGGFTPFVAAIAARVGFDAYDANDLAIEGGALTGAVHEPIKGRSAKEAALTRFAAAFGAPLEATLAVGDGANDLLMLDRAGLGVAFRAKPLVAQTAPARIDYGDLTALLYLQGYSDDAFAR